MNGSRWDVTTHLLKHYHKHLLTQTKTQSDGQTNLNIDASTGKLCAFRCSDVVARQQIVRYIQIAHQPFGFAENSHFVDMIRKSFQPCYEPISRSIIRRDIMTDYAKCRTDLIAFFKKL